jgi:hypothetical protein
MPVRFTKPSLRGFIFVGRKSGVSLPRNLLPLVVLLTFAASVALVSRNPAPLTAEKREAYATLSGQQFGKDTGAVKHDRDPAAKDGQSDAPVAVAAQSKGEERTSEASEYVILFRLRLKITDLALIFFNALLFLATLLLWWHTRKLVHGAERTARQQLRAYVFPSKPRIVGLFTDAPMMACEVRNFGTTPAYEMRIAATIF